MNGAEEVPVPVVEGRRGFFIPFKNLGFMGFDGVGMGTGSGVNGSVVVIG